MADTRTPHQAVAHLRAAPFGKSAILVLVVSALLSILRLLSVAVACLTS